MTAAELKKAAKFKKVLRRRRGDDNDLRFRGGGDGGRALPAPQELAAVRGTLAREAGAVRRLTVRCPRSASPHRLRSLCRSDPHHHHQRLHHHQTAGPPRLCNEYKLGAVKRGKQRASDSADHGSAHARKRKERTISESDKHETKCCRPSSNR